MNARSFPLWLLSLLLLCVRTSAAEATPGLVDDYARLQGRWLVLRNEIRKIETPEMSGHFFVFQGRSFRIDNATSGDTYSLDEAKSPKCIDFDDGRAPIIRGIYKIVGDSLIICTGAPGARRPREFKTSFGTGTVLTELTRAK